MCPGMQERIAKKKLGFNWENSSDLAPILVPWYTLTRFSWAEAKSLSGNTVSAICVCAIFVWMFLESSGFQNCSLVWGNQISFEISIIWSCGCRGKFGNCQLCGWTKRWKKQHRHTEQGPEYFQAFSLCEIWRYSISLRTLCIVKESFEQVNWCNKITLKKERQRNPPEKRNVQ